jgi:hypothetical protein
MGGFVWGGLYGVGSFGSFGSFGVVESWVAGAVLGELFPIYLYQRV